MTMAGITGRLAEACCGSSAALSDTQDIEADRADSSQCHGEDQQESADQNYVFEAGLEVPQGQAAAVWLGPAMCNEHMCIWCCCLPNQYGSFEQLAAIATLSQLMCSLSGFVTCFNLMTVWCCQHQPKPLTQVVFMLQNRTASQACICSRQLAPACRLMLLLCTSVKLVIGLSIGN